MPTSGQGLKVDLESLTFPSKMSDEMEAMECLLHGKRINMRNEIRALLEIIRVSVNIQNGQNVHIFWCGRC